MDKPFYIRTTILNDEEVASQKKKIITGGGGFIVHPSEIPDAPHISEL